MLEFEKESSNNEKELPLGVGLESGEEWGMDW